MKKHTTTESAIIEVTAFINCDPSKYVGPVLLAIDENHKPRSHEVVADEDGTYRHRITWPDHSGVYLHHTRPGVSAMTMRLLHDEAYQAAEYYEYEYHGKEVQ